jgi:CheY-like chemotaxis protein
MAHKALLPLERTASKKRLLIVAATCTDADMRSAYLRTRGYEVDCVSSADSALKMSRINSYDLVVLTIESECLSIQQTAHELQRLNPNSAVACLADCKKPIPPMPCDRLLWKGEPLEYFVARVETLASA